MKTLILTLLVLVPVATGAAPRIGLVVGNAQAPPMMGPLSTYLVEPCRFLDTRDDETLWYERPGPVTHGQTRLYLVEESCQVPLGSAGVILNVTVTDATARGHLALWRPDNNKEFPPPTSAINFAPGTTVANGTIVMLNPAPPGGIYADLRMYAHVPGGKVDVVIDVIGYLR